MSEEKAIYELSPLPAATVQAVRLEHFGDFANWQSFLSQRLFQRYPAARIVTRNPQVALVELRMSNAWTLEDDAFFAEMRKEGYFQRWEMLTELPPVPKHNK